MKHTLTRVKRWYPVRAAVAYGTSGAGNYASGLAFNLFICSFPLILGTLSALGFVMQDKDAKQSVERSVVDYFPSGASGGIDHALNSLQSHSGVLGAVSLLGLIWSGSSLFAAMEWPFDEIYGVKQRPFIKQRLMALGMTVAFAATIVAAVLANAALNLVHGFASLTPLVGFLVWTAFLVLLYEVVPNCHIGFRRVVPGALTAGIAMEAVTLLWPLYLSVSHGFDTYGSALALFFLLAAWLYLVSQVILVGMVVNNLGHKPEDVPKLALASLPAERARGGRT